MILSIVELHAGRVGDSIRVGTGMDKEMVESSAHQDIQVLEEYGIDQQGVAGVVPVAVAMV